MPKLSPADIEKLAGARLETAGASPAQARPVARSVARAEADGIGLVGLGYLPTYLGHLRSGKVAGDALPTCEEARAGVVLVDAAHGFAHPAFDSGMTALVAAARKNGVASLAIRRSYSIGVLGHPVEDIAAEGLVALAFTNSPPNIAPWGGKAALFGTNPLAFAAPRTERPPLVIDQATTTVTKVALAEAARKGEPIPEGWALDRDGRPTTDADAALKGSMLAFGGAKGAALALMIDLLAAGLTGANFSKDASPYARAEGPPPGVGQLFLAFDPDAFAPGFRARIESVFAAMLTEAGVRLPGERRLAARARAETEGIVITDAQLAMLEGG